MSVPQVHFDLGGIYFQQGCSDHSAYEKAREHFRLTRELLSKVWWFSFLNKTHRSHHMNPHTVLLCLAVGQLVFLSSGPAAVGGLLERVQNSDRDLRLQRGSAQPIRTHQLLHEESKLWGQPEMFTNTLLKNQMLTDWSSFLGLFVQALIEAFIRDNAALNLPNSFRHSIHLELLHKLQQGWDGALWCSTLL